MTRKYRIFKNMKGYIYIIPSDCYIISTKTAYAKIFCIVVTSPSQSNFTRFSDIDFDLVVNRNNQ